MIPTPTTNTVAEGILDAMDDLGIVAWVDGDRIRCRSKNGVPDDLARKIRAHKPALLRILRHQPAPHEIPPIPAYNPRQELEPETEALALRLAALGWPQIQILGETPLAEGAWLAWLHRRMDSDRHLYTLDLKLREMETNPPPAPHIPTREELLATAEGMGYPPACIVMARIEGRQAWQQWTDKHHHDPVYMRIAWQQLRHRGSSK